MNKNKREAIIQSTTKILIQHGLSGLKLNLIAKQAKVPAPLIHYYFEDLDQLLREVILQVAEDGRSSNIGESSKFPHDPKRMIEEYIRSLIKWVHEKPELMQLWMLFYYLCPRDPKLLELQTEIRNTGRTRIQMMIYSGIEKQLFQLPSGLTVHRAARQIQSFLTGQVHFYATENSELSLNEWIDESIQGVWNWLHPIQDHKTRTNK